MSYKEFLQKIDESILASGKSGVVKKAPAFKNLREAVQFLREKKKKEEENMSAPTGFTGKGWESSRIIVMQDHKVQFPELYVDVHIVGPSVRTIEMFARSRCTKAGSLENADLVIFTGGPDVDPQLYGKKPHSKTHSVSSRDTFDIKAYDYCQKHGVPMVGICRGAQFLHIMNGGKMFQDVDGHFGDHSIIDEDRNVIDRVSSTHHQLCIPNKKMKILATADNRSKIRWFDNKYNEKGGDKDIEAFYYEDTVCIGFQGHPEYRDYPRYTTWCLDKIREYIVEGNPILEWRSDREGAPKSLRIKKDRIMKDVFLIEDADRFPPWEDPEEPAPDPTLDDNVVIPSDLSPLSRDNCVTSVSTEAEEDFVSITEMAEEIEKNRRKIKKEERKRKETLTVPKAPTTKNKKEK